jgi:hypothetical protein
MFEASPAVLLRILSGGVVGELTLLDIVSRVLSPRAPWNDKCWVSSDLMLRNCELLLSLWFYPSYMY